MSRTRADAGVERGARARPEATSPAVTGPVFPASISVVDSHTEGEPTRVVVAGWPQPTGRTMAERRDELREHHDHLRTAVICEPRGHSAVVGALLTPPVEAGSGAGVIFFNNAGYLGMCGHGLMGVVRTLAHLVRLGAGSPREIRIDTPVGTVSAQLHDDRSIAVRNVPAACHARDVAVDVPGVGRVVGDIAWGGNWFFITHLPDCRVSLGNLEELGRVTREIRAALHLQGITGPRGEEIDHVEVAAAPERPDADSKNYVLCPGGEYDRSPCGTGTCARMAALFARGELALEHPWRQESITGSLFTGWLTEGEEGALVPHIRGHAWITGETTLYFAGDDPFRAGFCA